MKMFTIPQPCVSRMIYVKPILLNAYIFYSDNVIKFVFEIFNTERYFSANGAREKRMELLIRQQITN